MALLARTIALASLLASSACAPDPITRYAYVIKDVDKSCGDLMVFDSGELLRWEADEFETACQLRPHFGPNSELAWFSEHAALGLGVGQNWLHAFVPGGDAWVFHRYSTQDFGRAHFSPSGAHLGIFVTEENGGIEQAWFETLFGDRDGWMTVWPQALQAQLDFPKVRWSPDGSQFFTYGYGAGAPGTPLWSLVVQPVVELDENAELPEKQPAFPDGVLTFDGEENYRAVLDGVWVEEEVLILLAQELSLNQVYLEVTAGTPNQVRVLESGTVLSTPFPSPDGSKIAWTTTNELYLLSRDAPEEDQRLLILPGDPLDRRARNLLWLDDDRIAYTVEDAPKRIDVYSLESGEASVFAEDPLRDVFDLAYDRAASN